MCMGASCPPCRPRRAVRQISGVRSGSRLRGEGAAVEVGLESDLLAGLSDDARLERLAAVAAHLDSVGARLELHDRAGELAAEAAVDEEGRGAVADLDRELGFAWRSRAGCSGWDRCDGAARA